MKATTRRLPKEQARHQPRTRRPDQRRAHERGVLDEERCPVRALHPEVLARAQAAQRPDEDYANLAETFRALGDASRAKILHALLSEELCVCDLAVLAGISESAVSQHLRVLRSLRLVRHRKVGRVVYYSLEDACVRALLAVALTHLDDPAAVASRVPASVAVVMPADGGQDVR